MTSQENLNPVSSVPSDTDTFTPVPPVLGDFHPYDPQLDIKDIAGTRVVKCLYHKKTNKQSVYVRIPDHITEEVVTNNLLLLLPYIVTFLQDVEAKEIAEYHRNGGLTVYTDGLTITKVVERLERLDQGERLTKEKLESWFDTDLIAPITEKFANKMGIDGSSVDPTLLAKLELVVTSYRTRFASLAGGKTIIKESDLLAMQKVLDVVRDDPANESGESPMTGRIRGKIERMLKPVDEEELLMEL